MDPEPQISRSSPKLSLLSECLESLKLPFIFEYLNQYFTKMYIFCFEKSHLLPLWIIKKVTNLKPLPLILNLLIIFFWRGGSVFFSSFVLKAFHTTSLYFLLEYVILIKNLSLRTFQRAPLFGCSRSPPIVRKFGPPIICHTYQKIFVLWGVFFYEGRIFLRLIVFSSEWYLWCSKRRKWVHLRSIWTSLLTLGRFFRVRCKWLWARCVWARDLNPPSSSVISASQTLTSRMHF